MSGASNGVICQHCKKFSANRPRRLCWACYYNNSIRERYAPETTNGVVAGLSNLLGMSEIDANTLREENRQRVGRLPDSFTNAPPGSPEKKMILAMRARLKQSLHHPLDLKVDLRLFPARIPGIDIDTRKRKNNG